MKKATMPRCAELVSGMKKHMPAASKLQHMLGNVKRSSPRRPKVSIVHTAGHANKKLTAPKPKEARSAPMLLAPESLKMVDE
jgi:hypothetical protein